MMFYVPLMCCEYRDVSLLMRVQRSQRATALCDSSFTGSKDALCFSVIIKMFDLRNLGLGCSEGASESTQIHPIWWI